MNPGESKAKEEFMPCKFCNSTKSVLVRVTRNINGGDNLIYPHVHFNMQYNCSHCHRDFGVRMELGVHEYLEKLYYGDIVDGRRIGKRFKRIIVDMSQETQDEIGSNVVPQVTYLTEKSKTIRELVEHVKAEPYALSFGGLDLDDVLQEAYEQDTRQVQK